MRIDYHMHLEQDNYVGKCRFTLKRVEEYVIAADRKGIDEIAITEHDHRFREFEPIMRPILTGEGTYPQLEPWIAKSFHEHLEEYVEVLVKAKERGWPVKVGIEVDWVPGQEEAIRAALEPYPWDVVLGSVHFLGKWPIDYSPEVGWPEKDPDWAFTTYFETLEAAAASGLFDILTHPDLIKKFGHKPTVSMEPYWERVARAAAKAGCTVEVSTAGLRKPVGEIYPSAALLKVFHEAQLPISLASDAHDPADVGYACQEAVEWARRCGYDRVVVYEGRRRTLEPLG